MEIPVFIISGIYLREKKCFQHQQTAQEIRKNFRRIHQIDYGGRKSEGILWNTSK